MLKNRFFTAACAVALVGTQAGFALEQALPEIASSQVVPEGFANIDAMVEQALEQFPIPGIAVGIVVDGKPVFAKGYGFRDKEKQLPVTEETLFAIGSCTKAFTTHVLGQLADEGKISWDDPVIKHLPDFRLQDEYATFHMTIRDLVTHQSGMPRHDAIWYSGDLSRDQLLARLPHLDSNADLRGKFQ